MSVVDERNWSNTAASKQGRVVMSGIIDRSLLIRQKANANANLKLYPNADTEDILLGVEPGEILVARNHNVLSDANYGARKTLNNKRLRMRDPDPPVISKVNGVYLNSFLKNILDDYDDDLDIVEQTEKTFRYVGISNTRYNFDSKNKDLQKTGIAIQIGGTLSIINTGDQNIRQFDKVCWSFPKSTYKNNKSYAGVDKRALAIHTVPYDPTGAPTYDMCMEMMDNAQIEASSVIGNSCKRLCENIKAVKDNASNDNIRAMFYTMGLCHAEQRDKIIGVALSSAGSKEQFDIMLGNHH